MSTHFDNLLRYGQPYDPNNHFESQFYRHDLEGAIGDPIVQFAQEDVFLNGFGQDIKFDDFDLVKDLRAGNYNAQLQANVSYTLSDLQGLGISTPAFREGVDYGQHALGTDLYLVASNRPDPGISPNFSRAEAAYIFGSVRYEISPDTTFTIRDGELVIDGAIRLQNDNFDHDSGTINNLSSSIFVDIFHIKGGENIISTAVQLLLGDEVNFDKVLIIYEGEGPSRRIVATIEDPNGDLNPNHFVDEADKELIEEQIQESDGEFKKLPGTEGIFQFAPNLSLEPDPKLS